jgi:RNA-binding protein
MYELALTGAQRSHLRGLGQSLPDHVRVGKAGVTPAFLQELQRLLRANELVKLRFVGADREERAALGGIRQIEGEGGVGQELAKERGLTGLAGAKQDVHIGLAELLSEEGGGPA